MGEKKIWPPGSMTIVHDPDPDLPQKERRNLQRDVQYWKESSKRKEKDIKVLTNKIRGYKSHITRLQDLLSKKGVYNV